MVWPLITIAENAWTLARLTRTIAGKQWHEPKKAFRPASGLTPYAKRAKDRVTHALVKAKEKEMKDEKEAERQVCTVMYYHTIQLTDFTFLLLAETDNTDQREACRQGGKGEIRLNSREGAQEEGREIEAQREAQQAAELMSFQIPSRLCLSLLHVSWKRSICAGTI